MKPVRIDDKTKAMLLDSARIIEEVQGRINIICQTYLNAKGVKGNYTLAKDFSELTPQVEPGAK